MTLSKMSKIDAARTRMPQGAERFWDALPSKSRVRSSRVEFLKSWNCHDCEGMEDEIFVILTQWLASRDWRKDDGAFVPAAHRLINKRFWETSPGSSQSGPATYRKLNILDVD